MRLRRWEMVASEIIELITNAIEAIRVASAELDEIKRRLREHPEVDTSATDETLKRYSPPGG